MNEILSAQKVTLLDLLKKLLDEGVVVSGDLILSSAGVDLVYLDLKLLLSSVETLLESSNGRFKVPAGPMGGSTSEKKVMMQDTRVLEPQFEVSPERLNNQERLQTGLEQLSKQNVRVDANPNNTEKGLAKLVLTIVELLRRLMEHEAMRRIKGKSLSEEQIIEMGNNFESLDRQMKQMLLAFGLKEEDLNINLGPLGDLM